MSLSESRTATVSGRFEANANHTFHIEMPATHSFGDIALQWQHVQIQLALDGNATETDTGSASASSPRLILRIPVVPAKSLKTGLMPPVHETSALEPRKPSKKSSKKQQEEKQGEVARPESLHRKRTIVILPQRPRATIQLVHASPAQVGEFYSLHFTVQSLGDILRSPSVEVRLIPARDEKEASSTTTGQALLDAVSCVATHLDCVRRRPDAESSCCVAV